jgi:hypothetical protein
MTSRGATIDWLPIEPAVTQVNPVMLGAKAPHPNAARLFTIMSCPKKARNNSVGFREYRFAKTWSPIRQGYSAGLNT